jgi:hypothetical protein
MPASGSHIGFDSSLYRNRWAWSAGGAKLSEPHIVINFGSVYSIEMLRLVAKILFDRQFRISSSFTGRPGLREHGQGFSKRG